MHHARRDADAALERIRDDLAEGTCECSKSYRRSRIRLAARLASRGCGRREQGVGDFKQRPRPRGAAHANDAVATARPDTRAYACPPRRARARSPPHLRCRVVDPRLTAEHPSRPLQRSPPPRHGTTGFDRLNASTGLRLYRVTAGSVSPALSSYHIGV
jgi:hypothetical protein